MFTICTSAEDRLPVHVLGAAGESAIECSVVFMDICLVTSRFYCVQCVTGLVLLCAICCWSGVIVCNVLLSWCYCE